MTEAKSPVSYMTIHNSLIANGDRHKYKGLEYQRVGNIEYAIDCYRKMLRNYEAALALQDFKDAGLRDLVDRLAQMIANQLMTGN